LFRPGIAELNSRRPGDLFDRIPGIFAPRRVRPYDFFVDFLGHFALVHQESIKFDGMRWFGIDRTVIRAHDKLAGRDRHHIHPTRSLDQLIFLGARIFLLAPAASEAENKRGS
jgi:hypothetical protein